MTKQNQNQSRLSEWISATTVQTSAQFSVHVLARAALSSLTPQERGGSQSMEAMKTTGGQCEGRVNSG